MLTLDIKILLEYKQFLVDICDSVINDGDGTGGSAYGKCIEVSWALLRQLIENLCREWNVDFIRNIYTLSLSN